MVDLVHRRAIKEETIAINRALEEWKISLYEIIDTRISFYSRNKKYFTLKT